MSENIQYVNWKDTESEVIHIVEADLGEFERRSIQGNLIVDDLKTLCGIDLSKIVIGAYPYDPERVTCTLCLEQMNGGPDTLFESIDAFLRNAQLVPAGAPPDAATG